MKSEVKKKPTTEENETSSEPIEFNDWFSMKLQTHRRLEAHHYNAILAFFKNHNLTEMEPESKYDSMLKVFGY